MPDQTAKVKSGARLPGARHNRGGPGRTSPVGPPRYLTCTCRCRSARSKRGYPRKRLLLLWQRKLRQRQPWPGPEWSSCSSTSSTPIFLEGQTERNAAGLPPMRGIGRLGSACVHHIRKIRESTRRHSQVISLWPCYISMALAGKTHHAGIGGHQNISQTQTPSSIRKDSKNCVASGAASPKGTATSDSEMITWSGCGP